jgi:hypothetical protein
MFVTFDGIRLVCYMIEALFQKTHQHRLDNGLVVLLSFSEIVINFFCTPFDLVYKLDPSRRNR